MTPRRPTPTPSTDPIPHHFQRGLLITPVQYEDAFLCSQEQVLVCVGQTGRLLGSLIMVDGPPRALSKTGPLSTQTYPFVQSSLQADIPSV